MPDDDRVSRSPMSGVVTIPATNNSDHEVLDLLEGETLATDYIKVDYSGGATAETEIVLKDDSDDEGDFEVGQNLEKFFLSPGDRAIVTEGTYDDIQNGVTATSDGNADGEIVVTVGGMKITG